ncbi:sigma-70 family RNA polymerase sigma factor [Fodinibius halophilus]|uniref:Sigma-70 family RNA polymerase sigma factor n=1 Tax=Fodinibius halophilus TaxID=1736908 RepID=A0A6M1SZZ4_9BACT|nr:sigma-70 family RNA polymerase sigma factor [Fodinibius halophilus]NGP87219.1 sigma-70 family RNA polymerase sigma factor [Fodinibius halophilus]
MSSDSKSNITQLLVQASSGDQQAYDKLFPMVYNRLREIAHRQLGKEHTEHTLQKTELVHEAYLKLTDINKLDWQNRAHFFAIATKAMRQILIDYARKKTAQKRGGQQQRISFEEGKIDLDRHAQDLIALNDLIDKMAEFDERKSRVAEMRFFTGMTNREIAEILDVSTRTIDRDWLKARSWLHKELKNV